MEKECSLVNILMVPEPEAHATAFYASPSPCYPNHTEIQYISK